jgi:hypothetical protein
MNKIFEDLKLLKKQYEDNLQKDGKTALQQVFKDLFAAHPNLKSVVWTQYTPYFNDGDPCYFRVREFDVNYALTEEDDPNVSDYNHGDSLYSLRESEDEAAQAAAEAVCDLEDEIPQDILEATFGDHCKVVATPKGFDVEEHSHD